MKKPKNIKHAYVDSDLLIFPAAASAQNIEYYFEDEQGNKIGSFKDARSAANWIEEYETMEYDPYFDFNGDVSELTRKDTLHIGDFEDAIKSYNRLLKRWVKASGATSYTAYVSKKSGLENFRHKVALRKPYKGNRKGSQKPYYLEHLRQYVLTLPHHKKATGDVECDDVVCGLSQRKPTNVLIQNEKDSLQCVKCFVYVPDYHEEPVWSCPDTVGYLETKDGKKYMGLGHLFLLFQVISGDPVDHYSGLDGVGAKGAYKMLSPYNNKPVENLRDAVGTVCQAYYNKYGKEYQYIDKDGEADTASWKDFLLESLNLAYMRKNRNDLIPEPYVTMINEWEQEIDDVSE